MGPPLNAAGRVQAAQAADAVYRVGRQTWVALPPVTRILASPLQRTQDTAGALGRRLGLKVEIDERAREVDFGAWQGLTAQEAFDRDGDLIRQWDDGEVRAPGGESLSDVVARMRAFAEELCAEHALARATDDVPRTLAIVSHSVAIKSFVGGGDGVHALDRCQDLAHASVAHIAAAAESLPRASCGTPTCWRWACPRRELSRLAGMSTAWKGPVVLLREPMSAFWSRFGYRLTLAAVIGLAASLHAVRVDRRAHLGSCRTDGAPRSASRREYSQEQARAARPHGLRLDRVAQVLPRNPVAPAADVGGWE